VLGKLRDRKILGFAGEEREGGLIWVSRPVGGDSNRVGIVRRKGQCALRKLFLEQLDVPFLERTRTEPDFTGDRHVAASFLFASSAHPRCPVTVTSTFMHPKDGEQAPCWGQMIAQTLPSLV
jgi:hypothetical protein